MYPQLIIYTRIALQDNIHCQLVIRPPYVLAERKRSFRQYYHVLFFSLFSTTLLHTNMDSKNRDVFRGVWELSRLHTREAWICWYPAVWGACIAAGTQNVSFDICTFGRILFGIWASVTSTHCTFCTFKFASP